MRVVDFTIKIVQCNKRPFFFLLFSIKMIVLLVCKMERSTGRWLDVGKRGVIRATERVKCEYGKEP